jgi:hypothetical protein
MKRPTAASSHDLDCVLAAACGFVNGLPLLLFVCDAFLELEVELWAPPACWAADVTAAAEEVAEAPLEGMGDTMMVLSETMVLAVTPLSVSVDVFPYITVDGSTITGTMT